MHSHRSRAGCRRTLCCSQARCGSPIPTIRRNPACTGISAVIDPLGRILASLPLASEGVLDAQLPRSIGAPIYARLGDIPAAVLILLAFAIAVRGRLRARPDTI